MLRTDKKSEPQLSLITRVHPNEGETAVTTEEEAHRYGVIAAREGLNAYADSRRVPEAGHCCECGKCLWEVKSVPYNRLLDREHIMLIQLYRPKPPSPAQISYAAAFYCPGNSECESATRMRLTTLHAKSAAKWAPGQSTEPKPSK